MGKIIDCTARFSPRFARLDDGELSRFRAEESFTCSGSSSAVLLIFFSSSKNNRLSEVGVFLLVGGTKCDAGSFYSSSMTTVFGKPSRPRSSSLFDFFEDEEDEMLETRPSSVV